MAQVIRTVADRERDETRVSPAAGWALGVLVLVALVVVGFVFYWAKNYSGAATPASALTAPAQTTGTASPY